MKTESLMWLLPIVFMFHDFEEIIMLSAWLQRHATDLEERFPPLASRLLPHFKRLSTSSFSLAVAEEFVLLSAATYMSVERELYSLWAGILLAFFIHLIVHVAQFAVVRRYTPAIVTSTLSSAYCLAALYFLTARHPLLWSEVAFWTFVALIVLLLNLIFAHALAERFQRYLDAI